MTEEYFEKHRIEKSRIEIEKDLGVAIEPFTDEEIDTMYEALKALKEVVRDPQG